MEVYNSKYLHLAFFAEQELIEMTWLPSTATMTEEEYKKEFLNYLEVILKVRPKKIIPDTSNMLFPISPDLQVWTNQTIFPPSLEMGLNKAAFVVSQKMIAQLSIEQTMEEHEGVKFITRYFDNKEEAKTWITSL
ncbi:MAG: STAS/SEC14 domain-containing protein [Bernardetiaceae bacterium]|nr:STAS/SEC14 domain-containing protein [Bernardetiaceae bacterium]